MAMQHGDRRANDVSCAGGPVRLCHLRIRAKSLGAVTRQSKPIFLPWQAVVVGALGTPANNPANLRLAWISSVTPQLAPLPINEAMAHFLDPFDCIFLNSPSKLPLFLLPW